MVNLVAFLLYLRMQKKQQQKNLDTNQPSA